MDEWSMVVGPEPIKAGDRITVHKLGYVVHVPDEYANPKPDPDLDVRRAIAGRDMPASLHRLDHLTDTVSRAVLDLHRRDPWGSWDRATSWQCGVCSDGDGGADTWPCSTVDVVAAVHGISLEDFWLLDRPADGSLDQTVTDPGSRA